MAVKRIHKSRLAKASNRRLIDSEVQILKEMSHPHIVRLFDCITAPSDHICLVMEVKLQKEGKQKKTKKTKTKQN